MTRPQCLAEDIVVLDGFSNAVDYPDDILRVEKALRERSNEI